MPVHSHCRGHRSTAAHSPGAQLEFGTRLAQCPHAKSEDGCWDKALDKARALPAPASPHPTPPQQPPAHHGDPTSLQSGAQAAADALEALLGGVGRVLCSREKALTRGSQLQGPLDGSGCMASPLARSPLCPSPPQGTPAGHLLCSWLCTESPPQQYSPQPRSIWRVQEIWGAAIRGWLLCPSHPLPSPTNPPCSLVGVCQA